MKKIKLTPAEEQACRDVIAFWLTVERRLKAGEEIKKGRWVKNDRYVIDYNGRGCPFCKVAWDTKTDYLKPKCSYCVYFRTYNVECFRPPGHGDAFRKNPDSTTCHSAIESVEWILVNSEGR